MIFNNLLNTYVFKNILKSIQNNQYILKDGSVIAQ